MQHHFGLAAIAAELDVWKTRFLQNGGRFVNKAKSIFWFVSFKLLSLLNVYRKQNASRKKSGIRGLFWCILRLGKTSARPFYWSLKLKSDILTQHFGKLLHFSILLNLIKLKRPISIDSLKSSDSRKYYFTVALVCAHIENWVFLGSPALNSMVKCHAHFYIYWSFVTSN